MSPGQLRSRAPATAASVRGLSRKFGDRTVLQGVDLDIAHGEFIALIGRSGSGKSTLLRALKPFGAVPPLVTDINLSVDDQFLYVSCWGTGELKQYDVSDPAHPREVGSVRLGGITGRVAHPAAPAEPLAGGPQMVEVSRDGKRIYLTNSLYGSWDDQFYPDGVGSWLAKIDTDPAAGGGLSLDEKFFPRGEAWRGRRVHQVRLGGGDASSDSYCYRS